MKKKTLRLLWVIAPPSVAALGLAILSLINLQIPFNQSEWLAGDPEKSDVESWRYAMTKDVCKKTRDMPAAEVLRLLGSPAPYDRVDGELSYCVRVDYGGFDIDPKFVAHLVLKLDPMTRRVRECGVSSYERGKAKYEPLQTSRID